MSKATPPPATTTTVTYRTIYMPAKAERTKTFKTLGLADSRSLANNWIRNYGVEVISIDTEETR